jgi:predicted kinase
MPTIHFTTGLPASGKTTYAMELLRQSNGSMRRVNLDDIRAMLDQAGDTKVWTHRHEATAQAVQEAAVRAAVKDGFDVVVDNTHLTPRMPGRLKQVLGEFDELTFVVHDFTDVPLAECLIRDAKREKPVGEEAIRRLHSRHVSATKGGWRLTPEWLADRVPVHPYEPDASLPAAVMCDIDGTLALHTDRGPYDFDRCMSDGLNLPVFEALTMYRNSGHAIVLLSGRQEEYRRHTEQWLAEFKVPYDELWMRGVGDRRRDDIVKAELFDAHVRDRFNVRVSLDDRDRVVRLWRRLGLPTWQVNYGDF